MQNMFKWLAGATMALASLGAASGAYALGPTGNIVITVDENGHGTINGFGGTSPLAFALQADPGPGGLGSVLTYDLQNPPGLTAGDLLIDEGVGGVLGDVVRFNPNESGAGGGVGTLVFYSSNVGGIDSLADTPSPPTAFYANALNLAELNGSVDYTPTAGQPGFVTGAGAPVEYILISDAVPEPAIWAMMILGLGGLGLALRSSRRPRRLAATA